MADLERLDAGLLDVAGFECGHDAAAVVAKLARFIKHGAEAFANEPAIAAQMRRVVDQGRSEKRQQLAAGLAEPAGNALDIRGKADGLMLARQQPGASPGSVEPLGHGREIARSAATERQSRHGAGHIGRSLERGANIITQLIVADKEGNGVEAGFDGRGITQRSCEACRKLARARAGHGPIDGVEQAAAFVAGRGAHELQACPARSVDQQSAVLADAARRANDGLLAELGEIDVAQYRGDRGQLGARECAEGAQVGELELSLECALAGKAIERSSRDGRRRGTGALDPAQKIRLGECGIGGDHLARGQADQLARQVGARDLADLELARRNIERRERRQCRD